MSLASSPLARLHATVSAGLTPPPRRRAAFLLALAVLVVGMSLKYAAKTAKPGDGGAQTRSAFLRWRGMINDLFAGANIYVGVHEYPNPPVMAIILRPFAALPPTAGALAWFYLKAAMAALAAVWVFRLVAAPVRAGSVSDGVRGGAVAHTSGSENTMSDPSEPEA